MDYYDKSKSVIKPTSPKSGHGFGIFSLTIVFERMISFIPLTYKSVLRRTFIFYAITHETIVIFQSPVRSYIYLACVNVSTYTREFLY